MNTGTTLTVALIALAAGGFAGYRLAQPNHDAVPIVAVDAQKPAKKLLYYRNPMGLPDTSPVPKKDPMGMDYLPVYEGDEEAVDDGGLRISPGKVQKLGVRTSTASLQVLDRSLRASCRVDTSRSPCMSTISGRLPSSSMTRVLITACSATPSSRQLTAVPPCSS